MSERLQEEIDRILDIQHYADLTPDDIEWLRIRMKAYNVQGEMVDRYDRLRLIKNIFYHAQLVQEWMDRNRVLEKQFDELKDEYLKLIDEMGYWYYQGAEEEFNEFLKRGIENGWIDKAKQCELLSKYVLIGLHRVNPVTDDIPFIVEKIDKVGD